MCSWVCDLVKNERCLWPRDINDACAWNNCQQTGTISFYYFNNDNNKISGEEFIKINQVKPFKPIEDKSVALTIYKPTQNKNRINEIVQQPPPPLGEFGPPQGYIIGRRGEPVYLKPFITKDYILNKQREEALRQRDVKIRKKNMM